MKIFRRALAITFSVVAMFLLAASLIVRVAYNAALDTDTYVSTVTKIAEDPESLNRVSDFIENSLLDSMHLNDPQFYSSLQKAGIDGAKFESQARQVLHESVAAFISSDQFLKLWATTNRAAHTQLMTLVNSDTPATQDFMLDFGPVMKAAAAAIHDPDIKISTIIPLKNLIPPNETFQFKLIQANSVEDLRSSVNMADKARTELILTVTVLLALAWLLFGRTRGAHRVVAITIFSSGLASLAIRAVGKMVATNLASDEAKKSAEAIYTITTAPLTGYALFVLTIGAVAFGATFYKRTNN